MRRWSFTKGHGTQNDFVLLTDREDLLGLHEDQVRWICNRHAGIGADGVLRAVLAKHVEGWAGEGDLWFMDYRNADGSVAEICGNGARVFARYLLDEGLATSPELWIATRAGLRSAQVWPDGRVRVSMGPVTVAGTDVCVRIASGAEYQATRVSVGNPHAVSFVDDLDPLDLQQPPQWSPPETFSSGVNLEFVRRLGPRHLAMRVYERGVGETRSCGSGTVAAAAAAHAAQPDGGESATYRVDVPGGSVIVELDGEESYLTGPTVLVARGELMMPDDLEEERR